MPAVPFPQNNNRIVIAALDGELVGNASCGMTATLAHENPDYSKFGVTNREYAHIRGVVTYAVHKL
ncbi:MAG: hypothetical protein J6I40_09125 [Mailhella sp.]|nr:hypothetical protein [Mailhella sp.]